MNNTTWIEQHVRHIFMNINDEIEMDWIDNNGYSQKTTARSLQQCIDIATKGEAKSEVRLVIANIHDVDFALFLDGKLICCVDTGAGDSDEILHQAAQSLADLFVCIPISIMIPDETLDEEWSWGDTNILDYVRKYKG